METLRRLLGAPPARQPPPRIESDEVYPVHMLDDTKTLRSIVVCWTLCFNDVLDAEMLHASLARLLEMGDWRRIGGRLRPKEDGGLEIHVPSKFTPSRPALFYTHQDHSCSIKDHPLASTLPIPTSTPSIHPGPETFRTFAASPTAPETLEDFLYTDAPQLSLHITTFTDSTLVALSWPHTLMDVMGQQALLRGWSQVLAGREADVAPLLGAREDVVQTLVDDEPVEKKEEYSLAQQRLKGWEMAKFGLRFAGDLLWNRGVETRTICLPKAALERLQRQAQADLAAATQDRQEKPFVSEGDVLTAWTLRAVASSLPQPRSIAALHALNARFRVSELMRAEGVYVQNMAVAAFTFVSSETATGPLGPIALENRRHLMSQATEPQVLAYLREVRNESSAGGDPASMLYCGSDALLMPFTNWTRADFFNTADFGPAVVRAGEAAGMRRNSPGTMVLHHAQSMRQSPTVRNVIVVLGKDHVENYWVSATLLPAAWAKIEEDLKSLSSD